MNVTSAETEDQVAGAKHVADLAVDPIESSLIADAPMAMGNDFIGNSCAGNSRDGRFTRWINIGYDHPIGIIKSPSKVLAQSLGAREAMRLEHSENAITPH